MADTKLNTAKPQAMLAVLHCRPPLPRAILFDSPGEFLTGEAIRWRARYSISLVLPGGPSFTLFRLTVH